METVIIYEGVPYVLTLPKKGDLTFPCEKCDLRHVCTDEDGLLGLRNLCCPSHMDGTGHFEENWDLCQQKIIEYTQFLTEEEVFGEGGGHE